MGVTSRLGLPYPEPTAANDVPRDIKALADALGPILAADYQGVASARPGAGVRGRYYWATDTKTLSRDDGTTWRVVYGLTEKLETTGTVTAGAHASGASGTAVIIGGFGQTTSAAVHVVSSASNCALELRAKGQGAGLNSAVIFEDENGVASAYFSGPHGMTNGETSLVIGRQRQNDPVQLRRVTEGAVDSGGAGYRVLRIANE